MLARKIKRILVIVVPLAVLVAYLFFWPVDIDPATWNAPRAPKLEGDYKVNARLSKVETFAVGGTGPEDVAVASDGSMIVGLDDGRLIKLDKSGTPAGELANTGGRPLGLAFDAQQNLIVADANKGLLSVSKDGNITVLSTEHAGIPFGFADDVDIAPDGVIYFSDASSRFSVANYKMDLLEHRPHGRLLAYNTTSKQTTLIAGELFFANGVAVSSDGAFVLVNETSAYRVTRVWLTGKKKREIFIDNLPGFPDGISTGTNGTFWLALASPRNSLVDRLDTYPTLRKVIARLPEFLQPAPARHGFVLGLDGNGKVIQNLQDSSEQSFSPITSAQEHGGYLYLGSLDRPALARFPLSKVDTSRRAPAQVDAPSGGPLGANPPAPPVQPAKEAP